LLDLDLSDLIFAKLVKFDAEPHGFEVLLAPVPRCHYAILYFLAHGFDRSFELLRCLTLSLRFILDRLFLSLRCEGTVLLIDCAERRQGTLAGQRLQHLTAFALSFAFPFLPQFVFP